MKTNKEFDQKIIDSIKSLSLDMIDKAGSGHPGISLGATEILYTLYSKHINFSFDDYNWINRDRFLMSCGHGSALLYSTLFFMGYNLNIDDLKSFRKINSKTPGHPELDKNIGVEMTTGPLGQGFASSIGFAIGERYLNSTFNKKNNIVDYYTYVLCSDGDLMEGVSYEAASLAGNLKLDKLIVLYDSNNITLDGNSDLSFSEDVLKRFEAMGWHTQLIIDGDKVDDINRAIIRAKSVKDKPSIIEFKTKIGNGSLKENTHKVHGAPLTQEDIAQFKEKRNIRGLPFAISNEVYELCKKQFIERNSKTYNSWKNEHEKFLSFATQDLKNNYDLFLKNEVPFDLKNLIPDFLSDVNSEMREINKNIMNVISDNLYNYIGGSADLSSSTKTFLDKYGVFSKNNYTGRNIYFGVREHAMAAIINGLALSGFRPFASTFLAFSDYMKPSIRLAALMDLPVTYVFTHDNISIGQDGATHQPIEQLLMLRSIPNINVYRPSDFKELVGSWEEILKSKKPSALIVSRSKTKMLLNTDINSVSKGAYIVRKEIKKLSGIIVATGTEVQIAFEIAEKLFEKNIDIRVVSMPSVELFEKQEDSYKDFIFPIGYKTIVIEFSSSLGWYKYVYNDKYLITLDEFGKSGKKDEIYEYFKLETEYLIKRVEDILR